MQQCDILCYFFNVWYESQSFVFLQGEFQAVCSFDNYNWLLWGCYLFGFWLLLALKFTIKIIGEGDMVGGGWKKFVKLIMSSLC